MAFSSLQNCNVICNERPVFSGYIETSFAISGKSVDVLKFMYFEACLGSTILPPVYDVNHHFDIDALILL
jgi:hypothetical protein